MPVETVAAGATPEGAPLKIELIFLLEETLLAPLTP
jgi:hypothetical protein